LTALTFRDELLRQVVIVLIIYMYYCLKVKKKKQNIAGEHPAAMQHGGQLRLANLPFVMISTTLLTLLNHPY